MVVIGAHIDHLGNGKGGLVGSRKTKSVERIAERTIMRPALEVMLEIAQYLANEQAAGKLKMKRDVLIAAWSGEELGLRGSQAFADDFAELFPERSGWT